MYSDDYKKFLNEINQGSLTGATIFTCYQNFSQEEQVDYLHKILTVTTTDWIEESAQYSLVAIVGFLNEFSDKNLLKHFSKGIMYEDFLHALFYASLDEKEEEFKLKKEGVNFFEKNFNFDLNKVFWGTYVLNLASMKSGVPFIHWLIQKGAKINNVDKDNDSFVSCTLLDSKPNLKVLEYAINLPSFNPLNGNNILSYALKSRNSSAISIICQSSLMENHEFLEKAKEDFPKEVEEIICSYQEKKKLESEIKVLPKTNNKVKI